MLQILIAQYPDLIKEAQIETEEENKLLLISKEAGISSINNRFSLDHLFLDQDGVPTFVEVKRSSDTRIRREVVGQMLDYAANAIVCWPVNEIKKLLLSRCEKEDIDPDELIQDFLKDDVELEDFWDNVYDNLNTGRIRLLFVADQIPSELKRIIEFLNEKMDTVEVLGVEIKQYVHDDLKTLVPQVVGQTEKAQIKKNQNQGKWNETSFFAELNDRYNNKYENVARKILNYFQPKVTRIYWGRGMRSGSFVPICQGKSTKHQLFAVWTYGKVGCYFEHYKTPFDDIRKKKELQIRLNKIEGVTISDDRLTKRPSINLSLLNNEDNFKKFTSAYDWFIEEIKQYEENNQD